MLICDDLFFYIYTHTLTRSCVRVVTSERAGMGKSLYIHRLTEHLMTKTSVGPHKVIIPIHGPKVTSDSVVSTLMNYCDNTNATIFHLDISPNVRNTLHNYCCKHTYYYACLCDAFGHCNTFKDKHIILRYLGNWIQYCFAYWYFKLYVIVREEYGDVIPHTCMPLK